MAGIIGAGVTLRGFYSEDQTFTYNLAAGIVRADVGKAMSLDTSAANTAKLAVADESILGVLVSWENRVQEGVLVGSICESFSVKLPYAGTIPPIGTQVCGSATPGSVKTATAALATAQTRRPAIVVEQSASDTTVVVHMV